VKRTLFLIPLIILNCSTAVITIDKTDMGPIKSIAIAPFFSEAGIGPAAIAETENAFREVFLKLGYNIIEQDKIESMLRDEEFSATGITQKNIQRAGKILGADAILFGVITEYKEETRIIRPSGRFGLLIHDREHKKTEYKTFYRFRVLVKLASTADSSVIMTAANRYPEAEHDDYMPAFVSLEAYRRYVCRKTGEEIIQKIQSGE